jgi:hypothetical protein
MAMLTAACHVLLAGIKVAAADDASRLGAWPMKVDGRGGLRTSGCGRQRLTPSTDGPVMGRSADYSCFVSSVPERRLRARLQHGLLSHQVIALTAAGQLGMAAVGQIRLAVATLTPA